ncbi:hypothetical protein [Pseudoalteromonas denitrificans]|jgi:hypothetical protein|uniref:Uncharacterized protein n=1 Tax=Pseudoalteromonas denitrificans DSM 6059 TaxID=1123010 RepID=A0A1I1PJZ9_9GAMM|nr:hypothetical protein [Pseudoalteromonas denitrificans]SFD09977.1 hypothetical protein SAMN02745724_03486 [Pseudoalteromonas denitrificans DSM 6059]
MNKSLNRHVMAFITFILLLPLVYYIPAFVAKNVSDNDLYITIISVAIIVPVLTYILIPLVTRLIYLLVTKVTKN